MEHAREFLDAMAQALLDVITTTTRWDTIERLADALASLEGRLFILGIGGSAANASHAVNDFRKLCNIEAYAPTDNVAELTAWTNDAGWEIAFRGWLSGSKLNKKDALLVLSVGGGDAKEGVSVGLICSIEYAHHMGAQVWSIVGRKEGYAAQNADICILLPEVRKKWLTPLSESYQSIICHLLTSHPKLQKNPTKW
jgi:D-sedoheptulose 7-phosphate isomerase